MIRPCLPRFIALASLCCLSAQAAQTEAPRVSPLGKTPDWEWLAAFDGALTRSQFTEALNTFYAPEDAAASVVEIKDTAARIRTGTKEWREVRFAKDGDDPRNSGGRFWRRAGEMGPFSKNQPLGGVRIVIDPGHLGGNWAKMEEREFQIGKTRPVREGDLTLQTALRLKPLLEKRGATVHILRSGDRPATKDRPETLQSAAAADLTPEATADKIRRHSELFFYRISEIRARAAEVNERWKPDLVVCLHFNAEEWGEPENPRLVPRNHLHALVNGSYSAQELEWDDVRSEMLQQLFSRTVDEAIPVSEAVLDALAEETHLPPYTYFSKNARRVGSNPYLYTRNLLATRLYHAPVVFLEPYVMNSQPVWERVQKGDYNGFRILNGTPRRSLPAEYAAGVASGLERYYRAARPARLSNP